MVENSIQIVDYKDWFLNQKRLPDKSSTEYKAFYDFHKELCLHGCMMEGEYINPFLYWHLNIWHTEVDYVDDWGRISDKYANPLLRDNEWIVTNEIDRAHKERKGLVILGIRRFAKALKNNELLYTEFGEIEIGDALVGQRIYDHNGKLTTITGVFPQGKIPIYKMSLEDGREIYCCENHIWRVLDRRNGRKVKDLSIKELLPIYKHSRVHNGYKDKVTRNIEECFFAIPNNKAVPYDDVELSINPYFLGLWLGDGNSRNLGITTVDEEIKNFIYEYAEQLKLKVREDKDSYFITSGIRGGITDKNSLTHDFKEYNLFKNKHIPIDYLRNSIENRMSLLQGMIDADGSVYKNGTICYTTTSERLADDFFSLCRSLGINLTKKEFIPKLYGKPCGRGWRFTLFTELPICRLSRKLDRVKKSVKGKQSKINWTTIRKIELVEEDEATCITVDNKDKLFLTTDYTVTHNSVIEASYIGWGATFDENSQNVIAGLNAPDIKLITDKLDKGLNFIPEAWRWQRIEDNWAKQVTLGIKTRQGARIPFSQILIRNLDEGNNEEAIAGTKPRKLIIDEIGKGSFLRGLKAAEPGFTTPYGWACSPILTGCVCAGTKVWKDNGEIINIETLQKDDWLLGYNGDRVKEQEINWFKVPEYKQCYRITTDDGNFIECSHDHPLLVTKRGNTKLIKGKQYRKTTYKNTATININDQLVMPSTVGLFGNESVPYARELGLMIGDGNYSFKSTPSLSCSDYEVEEYILLRYNTNITKCTEKSKQITIKNIKDILVNHRMYGQVKQNKRLPYDIHKFDKKSVANLLAGYFDADGNVYYNKKKNIVRIVLTSIVYELLQEVRYQLLKFGIHCCIIKERRNIIPSKGYEGQQPYIYRLYINQQQDIEMFRNEIHLLIERKRKVLNLLKFSKYNKWDGWFFINPDNNKEGYFNSDILYDLRSTTVTKIEDIGEQLVYNLNCGPNHNYISNGFITRQTGGDMKKFADAKTLMFDVANYNFLTYINEKDDRRVHGLYLSYKYRMEAKEPSSLGLFLNKPEDHPLYQVPMLVSNEQKARKVTDEKLESLKKGTDRLIYIKEKMYYPTDVDDIFSSEDTNIFDIESAKRQKGRLLANDRTGTPVFLFHDGEKICHEFTDKLPISNFPLKPNDDKDAPVVIYEFPIESPPYGLYVAGVDPYRQGKAKYSASLGSVYIYKRMHNLMDEKYQDMFVASYCARPDKKEKWEEQARLLIKYYNARTLCENDEISFIEYMKSKGDAHYLERQPEWLKEIVPNTTVQREYGIHRSAEKIINYLHTILKNYYDEVIYTEMNEEGSVTKETLGITRVLDPMLLEETIQYNEQDNFDRLVAAELAIAQAIKMDPIYGAIGKPDERINSLYKREKLNTLFTRSKGLFLRKKRKLFA